MKPLKSVESGDLLGESFTFQEQHLLIMINPNTLLNVDNDLPIKYAFILG